MKIVIVTIFFHLLCIIFFTIIYIYLKKDFIKNNSLLKNDVKLIDIIMFSTTIQAGVGLTNLLPTSFYSKLLIITQQMIMICSNVFVIYFIILFYK